MGVRGKLDAVRYTRRQVVHESQRVFAGPITDPVRDQKLGVATDRSEGPYVATAPALLFLRYLALLASDKSPYLVGLHLIGLNILHGPVVVVHALQADDPEQPRDGVLGASDHPSGGADRIALDQGGEDRGLFLVAQNDLTP